MVRPAATPLPALQMVPPLPMTSVVVQNQCISSCRMRVSMTAATLASTPLASTASQVRLTLLLRCRRPRQLPLCLPARLSRSLVLGVRLFPSILPARLRLRRLLPRLFLEYLCPLRWQLFRRQPLRLLARRQLLALQVLLPVFH